MPRIRTLKPEHRQHRKVGVLSHLTYRLWVGMICEADDEGRLVAEPAQLRALIFPYGNVRLAHIEDGLATLEKAGLIRRYVDFRAGTSYADFPSWHDHQVINKAKPSKLPSFNECSPTQSGTGTGEIPSASGLDPVGRDQGSRIKDQGSRKGKDQGRDGSPREVRERNGAQQDNFALTGKGNDRNNKAAPLPRLAADEQRNLTRYANAHHCTLQEAAAALGLPVPPDPVP